MFRRFYGNKCSNVIWGRRGGFETRPVTIVCRGRVCETRLVNKISFTKGNVEEPYMETIEKELIHMAETEYKKIFPCSHRRRLEECITRDNDYIYLWFNTEDESTHVMSKRHSGN